MPSLTPNDRQRRILQLSAEWGIVLPPAPHQLSRPRLPPTFRTHGDDQVADDLLQRHALDATKTKSKNSLTRAFSSSNLKKGKNSDPRDVLEVLASWIANGGSTGVVEALIGKLTAAGVDLAGMQQQKGGLLNRRRSLECFVDRTHLLKTAVENGQVETVQVLLPHADSISLDASLPVAIRNGNTPIVESLLRYGASLAKSSEGQIAFRQACSVHGLSHLINLVLQSDGRPPPPLVSESMGDAARAGCLETVLHLSRSTADSNYNQAEALRCAINMGRRDIAVAIVMGNKPPYNPGLNDAFRLLFEHKSLNPATKLDIAELLLCAGAEGGFLAQALEQACQSHFYDMVNLLAAYGASIEYNDAAVLKTAISRGQMDLVASLLNDRSILNPSLASSCVPLIPKQATFESRNQLLTLLLKKGANGNVLNEALINATEAGDTNSVELLLNPYMPSSKQADNCGQPSKGSRGSGRHAVASADHRDGEALRTAVLRGDTLMTQKILAGRPSSETLTAVFPLTRKLPAKDRYQMVELFLRRSLSGPCLHAALQHSIDEDVSQRDNALITLLLQHNADINFNQGAGLSSVIRQKDLGLLATLLKKASPQTAAARVQDAMRVQDHRARYETITMLLHAGAVIGVNEIATALLDTLSETPVDMSLLRLLAEKGNAEINALDGSIMKQAAINPDPKVLELVLSHGKPTADTITRGLHDLAPMPSTETKTWKMNLMLARSERKEDVSGMLVHEVQSLVRDSSEQPTFSALKLLLDAGADTNAFKSAALCHAVIAANLKIIELLFGCPNPPSPASLGSALPHALRILEPMDRLTLTKKLVETGALPAEVNRALLHAIATYPDDLSLLSVLASKADTSDGEALSVAVSKELSQVTDLLLTKSQHSAESRNLALTRAADIKNRAVRSSICQSLLASGVSPVVASNALLIAARDGDLKLGDILMAHGASISSNNGQAIIEACRGGSVEVLKVLLRSEGSTEKTTLGKGFQAATEVRDLNKRAMIFEQLLKKGVSGDLVDAQLQFAARYGEGGQGLLKVLLVAGADPNYNNGEAVVAATRSAFVDNLELLLGLWDDGSSQVSNIPPI